MRVINVALFVAMFLFISHLSGGLKAYLDPGTGSMALQLLMGGVVGRVFNEFAMVVSGSIGNG